jgi:hypothetical protein
MQVDDLALLLELTLLDSIDLELGGGPGTALDREGALVQRLTNRNGRRLATAQIATRWIGERLHELGGKRLMQKTLLDVAGQYAIRSPRMRRLAEDAWNGIA